MQLIKHHMGLTCLTRDCHPSDKTKIPGVCLKVCKRNPLTLR